MGYEGRYYERECYERFEMGVCVNGGGRVYDRGCISGEGVTKC